MRKFFSLLTGALFGALVLAGPASAQGLSLGAEAGVNLSNLSVDDESVDFGSTTGIRVGGTLGYDAGVLGFQTGAAFSQKGASFESLEDAGLDDASLNLEYLEVPLLMNLDIPTGPAPVSPTVYAGGNFGFELSCGISASAQGVEGSSSCAQGQEDVAVETKSLDVGLLVGGGLDFSAGPGALTVDVRYDLGLSDITDDEGATSPVELKNRNVQATAGYAIGLP